MEVSGYKGFGSRLKNSKVGDVVMFGAFDLPTGTKPNCPEVRMPIVWKIVDKDSSKIKLFSVYLLDWEGFEFRLGGAVEKATWKDSYIRSLLNETYIEQFFSESERKAICQTQVTTVDRDESNHKNKVITNDYLFLPSYEELSQIPQDLMSSVMPFAETFDDTKPVEVECSYSPWWLRTSAQEDLKIMCVDCDGMPDMHGAECYCEEIGIRPMLWIDTDLL